MSSLPAHWASRQGLGALPPSPASVLPRPEDRRSTRFVGASSSLSDDCARSWVGAVPARFSAAQPPGLVKTLNKSDKTPSLDDAAEVLGEDVIEFTDEEARKRRMASSVRTACKFHHSASKAEGLEAAFFTFTCRAGAKPKPRDISRVVECFKKWAKRAFGIRLRYVWVAELQGERARAGDAGAVHYHLCVWLPGALKRRGLAMRERNPKWKASGVLPKPDKKKWWRLGSTHRTWVDRSVRSYMAKYLSKGDEHGRLPRGLRSHGEGGSLRSEIPERSWCRLPKWLRDQVTPGDRCARASEGGGWVSRATGTRYTSPYRVILTGRSIRVVRLTACNAMTVKQWCESRLLPAMESNLRSKLLPLGSVSSSPFAMPASW